MSQTESLGVLAQQLPLENPASSFTSVLKYFLDQTGLYRAFYAHVSGLHEPRLLASCPLNLPDGYLEQVAEVEQSGGVNVDPLRLKSYTDGFWKVYRSSDVTPLHDSSAFRQAMGELHAGSEVITFGIRDEVSTHWISLFPENDDPPIADDVAHRFEQLATDFWLARQKELAEYPNVPQIFMPEKANSRPLDDLQQDLDNLHSDLKSALQEAQSSDNQEAIDRGVRVLKQNVSRFERLIKLHSTPEGQPWRELCPALLDWSSDPEFKQTKLRRTVDERTERNRYENAAEYIDRVVREAGLANKPYLHELRELNPTLARSLDDLAKREKKSVADYVPMKKVDPQIKNPKSF